jgi:hypothetical protein
MVVAGARIARTSTRCRIFRTHGSMSTCGPLRRAQEDVGERFLLDLASAVVDVEDECPR